MASIGQFPWGMVPGYIVAQIAGAFVGAVLVYITYKDHFATTDDAEAKLGVFATIPAIRNMTINFITEVIGTAMLLIGILGITNANNEIGALGNLMVGILIFGIGLSLGGPTGYSINPARDFGPRLAHAVLPIPGKGDSDWKYGLIVPTIGPIVGGIIGAFLYKLFI